MSFCSQKIDLILQYSLLIAGEEDAYFDRQLGPIHLLKYVYLADLAYARRNNGNTFTQVEWKFYNFGPWSNVVHSRIESSLHNISAQCAAYDSHFGDDDIQRWSKRDKDLLRNKQREIPPEITRTLKNDIHKYLKDTPKLLDYVYSTKPMLSAAPNEFLDFSSLVIEPSVLPIIPLRSGSLSNRKAKLLSQEMNNLRASFKVKKKKRRNLVKPVLQPRYDDVYLEAISLFDKAELEEFKEVNKTVSFADEVWKSTTRKGIDNDVS